MSLSWYHSKHGDNYHDLVIFLIERQLITRGAKLLDKRVFRDRKLPCMPDIYFSWEEVLIDGNRRRHVIQKGVIEVESHMTIDSKTIKRRQYEDSMVGVKLYIINLGELDRDRVNDLSYLEAWLERRLPV